MAFEPKYEVMHLDCQKRICQGQRVVDARLNPNGSDKIAKVLSIATDCSVAISEVFAGEVRYSGRVSFKVIYVDPDGGNHSMDYNAEFSDKLLCESIKAGQKSVLTASILDTEVSSVDERELSLASVVEIYLESVVSDSVNVLVSAPDGVYTHDEQINYTQLAGSGANSFLVSGYMEDVKCTKLLLAEPKVAVMRRYCAEDTVTLEGKVISDLTCETQDGMIVSYRSETEFVETVLCSGASDTDLAVTEGSLKNYLATIEENEDGCNFVMEYEIAVVVSAFRDESKDVVIDAFSVTNELMQSGESLSICKNILNNTVSERVEGSVTLDINMPIVDNILSVTGSNVNIALANAIDGAIVYDGMVTANIIYYSAERDVKSSVAVELPFSIKSNCDVQDGDEVIANGVVSEVATKIRRGNEIDIKADMDIEFLVTRGETKYVITNLTQGEERVLPTNAFSIHIAKPNETLWDVAKSLSSDIETIEKQNPSLQMPLTGGERIIAYRYLQDKT